MRRPTRAGRTEIFVQSFVSSGSRSQVSANGGTEPHWSPDGRTLYYQQNDQFVAIPVEPGAAFLPGKRKVLFSGLAQIVVDSSETYHMAPLGDRFVMMRPADDRASAPEVRIVLNWFADLRRAVAGPGLR
jgi:Tol biopolymer transport system component